MIARRSLSRLAPHGPIGIVAAAPSARARYRVAKAIARPSAGLFVVWIEDLNGALSVTNDAEAVCFDLQAGFPGYRIIYRDSMGLWDELLHERGHFTGFAPARTFTPESVK